MNLMISAALVVLSASYLVNATLPAGWYPSPDQHRLTRRNDPFHWLRPRTYSNGVKFNDRRPPRRHVGDDLTAAMSGLEEYMAANVAMQGQPSEDTIFTEVETETTIDFEGPKVVHPHSGQRLPCKTDVVNEESSVQIATPDIRLQPEPLWKPLVNESECQSYGPSQFCQQVANYPTELVNQILKAENGSLLSTFFANNVESFEDSRRSPALPTESSVMTRFKPASAPAAAGSEATSLCASKTEYLFPKSAKNLNNEELFIVNQDNVSQPITVETCRSENGPCEFADSFPAGFKAVCKQKYVTHHLAALKNGKIVRDAFTFPSCCVCVVKQTLFDRNSVAAMSSRMLLTPAEAPSPAGSGKQTQ